jgi:hypothetical protein
MPTKQTGSLMRAGLVLCEVLRGFASLRELARARDQAAGSFAPRNDFIFTRFFSSRLNVGTS